MIQSGTLLKIIDNTGAKTALCIKVGVGYKRRYAFSGDVVLVSVKSLRKKRREFIKIKKGDIYKALLLRVISPKSYFFGDFFSTVYFPSAVLLSKHNKVVGTRIFGSISKDFRFTKFLKVISLSSGICF